jgi:hypothetical protein
MRRTRMLKKLPDSRSQEILQIMIREKDVSDLQEQTIDYKFRIKIYEIQRKNEKKKERKKESKEERKKEKTFSVPSFH